MDNQGKESVSKEAIEKEVLQFYMGLLGSSKGSLKGVDVRVIR